MRTALKLAALLLMFYALIGLQVVAGFAQSIEARAARVMEVSQ